MEELVYQMKRSVLANVLNQGCSTRVPGHIQPAEFPKGPQIWQWECGSTVNCLWTDPAQDPACSLTLDGQNVGHCYP